MRISQERFSVKARISPGLVKRGGYDLIHESIMNVDSSVKEEIRTLVFGYAASDSPVCYSGARKQIRKLGPRPATISELLVFGAEFPEEQRKHTIVALGSHKIKLHHGPDVGYSFVWGVGGVTRNLPILFGNESSRVLGVDEEIGFIQRCLRSEKEADQKTRFLVLFD